MVESSEYQATHSSKRNAKEQDLKRQQGKISCAECHRLKLKCDRKVPCSSCVRRSCESICPTGSFLGGQSSRHLLVEMTIMQRNLEAMSGRIRDLEDALQASHAKTSRGQHPLLAEDLLAIKRAHLDMPGDVDEEEHQEVLDRETMVAFGKLSMSEEATELLGMPLVKRGHIPIEKPVYPTEKAGNNDSFTYLASEITRMAFLWPFTQSSLSPNDFAVRVSACLPTWERATALCEAYLSHRAWFLKGIEREHLVEEVMPIVYGGKRMVAVNNESVASAPGSVSSRFHPHLTPLLLSVFAVGASADFTQPSHNAEGETYFHLARAGLGVKPIHTSHRTHGIGVRGKDLSSDDSGYENVTLEMVQTISLLGLYCKFAEHTENATAYWNVAYVLAGTMSLHRDPTHRDLPHRIVQRRRSLFWELFTMNNWHSVSFVRPTVFCFHSTDCEFPEEARVDENELSFYQWKYMFAKEVLSPISEQICAAWPMKYSAILDMDRRIQNFRAKYPPKRHNVNGVLDEQDYSEVMQGQVAAGYLEMVSLVLHRNFFAKALLEHPTNPLASPFATSYHSAYRSAIALIKLLREQYHLHPSWAQRMWLMRGASLAAIVVIACVVMRTPTSELAPSAFVELGLAKTFFEKTALNPTAGHALPLITRLFEKSQRALYGATGLPAYQPSTVNGHTSSHGTTLTPDIADESTFTRTLPSSLGGFDSSRNPIINTGSNIDSTNMSFPAPSSSFPWNFSNPDFSHLPYVDSTILPPTTPSMQSTSTRGFLPFESEALDELELLAATDVDMMSDEVWRTFMGESRSVNLARDGGHE